MKTIWSTKRTKAGLKRSEIASELGISCERYISIEKGLVKMPTDLVDKFNRIVEKDKQEIVITRLENEKTIDEYIEWLITTDKKGNLNLDNKIKEFNINTYGELGTLLGYKSSQPIHSIKSKGVNNSYDLKNKLYQFFTNELNIQPPKVKEITEIKEIKEIKENDEVKKEPTTKEIGTQHTMYTIDDVDRYCKENNAKYCEIEKGANLSSGTLYHAKKNNSCFTISTNQKLHNYFNNINENDRYNDLIFPELPTTEIFNTKDKDVSKEIFVSVLDKVNDKLLRKSNDITIKLTQVKTDMNILENQLQAKQEEYDKLQEQKTIYDEILNDLRNEE